MLVKRTNIHEKLLREQERNAGEVNILNIVKEILNRDESQEDRITKTLNTGKDFTSNNFDFDFLDSKRIFHEDAIREICITYRLRFLDSRYFKGDFPQEAITEIKELEKQHNIALNGFKIIAPSKMFVLRKTDDPLLFARMGNGYYYLIHKWGNDLHPLRKWMMWPFKNFENLVFTVMLSSIIATMLVPEGLFSREKSLSQDVMVFFFMFKSIAAVVLYYGFAAGKNFNSAIWRSKYDKAQ